MSYDSDSNGSKSSADLEREVAAQRDRVEARIGEIKDRLSPGQLIDEALAYTKDGGSHFAANLGNTISANPLPAALLGVSLVWLMSGQGGSGHAPHVSSHAAPSRREPDYPYARVSGSGLRRTGHSADPQGQWWSEFESGDGGRYKARSNQKGDRLGHFVDDTGKFFSGFIDDTGNRIKQFQDEAGNVIDDAAGWASHAWSDLTHGVSDQLGHMGEGAQQLGREMQKQTDQLTQQIGRLFEQQPLIAGALAFAAGATLGAALPHTREEDKLVGKQGDKLRSEARHAAGDLYEKGKETVAEAYDGVAGTATEVYEDVKERIAGVGSDAAEGLDTRPGTFARH